MLHRPATDESQGRNARGVRESAPRVPQTKAVQAGREAGVEIMGQGPQRFRCTNR